MFGEKGIILRSAASPNVQITMALYENEDGSKSFLAKPTIRRINHSGNFITNQPYKSWLTAREVLAMATLLMRAAERMDKYEEGSLDLTHLLAEDEDARMFTRTKSVMYPTIDGMFEMDETNMGNRSEEENTGAIEVDPNDHF